MTYPFPTRTLASSTQQHLDDHNEIADILERPTFTLNSSSAEHLAEHNALHPDFGLPQRTHGTASSLHLTDHTDIHDTIVQEFAGPIGSYGQLPTASVPNYPSSGLVSISPGNDTIQIAIAANGNGTKFQLQNGTYFTSSRIEPKLGQEFWGVPGSLIAKASGTHTTLVHALSGRTGVKIMNIKFQGFAGGNSCVDGNRQPLCEVGYCEFDCTNQVVWGANLVAYVHHSKVFDFTQGGFGAFQMGDGSNPSCIVEHCEVGPNISTVANGNKWTAAMDSIYRHNWVHGIAKTGVNNRPGLWFDFMNFDDVIEWNLVEDNRGDGIQLEANAWDNNTGALAVHQNVIRYNWIKNNDEAGLAINGSTSTDIYRNVIENNSVTSGWAEVPLTLKAINQPPPPTNQGRDLFDTYVHHNIIRPKVGGRGGGFNFTADDPPSPIAAYRDTNTKNNRYNFNRYYLSNPSAGNHWVWFGTNKTQTTWKAVPAPGQGGQDFDSEFLQG